MAYLHGFDRLFNENSDFAGIVFTDNCWLFKLMSGFITLMAAQINCYGAIDQAVFSLPYRAVAPLRNV